MKTRALTDGITAYDVNTPRENFPMGDNFTGRYLNTNPNGDITIKSHWGTINPRWPQTSP